MVSSPWDAFHKQCDHLQPDSRSKYSLWQFLCFRFSREVYCCLEGGKERIPLWERNGLPIRRRNQRLAVVRWLDSFLSCCPSGNCLFPPVKRAEERQRWRPWCETPTPWYFGLLGLPTKPALRNPQPNISGQPGVVTPHLSFSFPYKKILWMICVVMYCTFLQGFIQTYLNTVKNET